MSNLFTYQQYVPQHSDSQQSNVSPTFQNLHYWSEHQTATTPNQNATSISNAPGPSLVTSSTSSSSSAPSNYSLHNPRLRYYLSKSFDAEDDMEFCPEISDNFAASLNTRKFNPYTAAMFLPTSLQEPPSPSQATPPRVLTPRIRKPIEIVNPKHRMGSPVVNK